MVRGGGLDGEGGWMVRGGGLDGELVGGHRELIPDLVVVNRTRSQNTVWEGGLQGRRANHYLWL